MTTLKLAREIWRLNSYVSHGKSQSEHTSLVSRDKSQNESNIQFVFFFFSWDLEFISVIKLVCLFSISLHEELLLGFALILEDLCCPLINYVFTQRKRKRQCMNSLVYNNSKGKQSFFHACWFITAVKDSKISSMFAGL